MYNFTSFAMQLNELHEDQADKVSIRKRAFSGQRYLTCKSAFVGWWFEPSALTSKIVG